MSLRAWFGVMAFFFVAACIADAANFFGRGGQVEAHGCGTSCGVVVTSEGGAP